MRCERRGTKTEAATPDDQDPSPIRMLSLSGKQGRVTATFPAGASSQVGVGESRRPQESARSPSELF